MVEIIWTPQSEEDLRSIYDYIAKDSARYAIIQVEVIISATDILIKNPEAGRMVPEIQNQKIRELIVGNYRVIYRTSSKKIFILTVHHGARRFPADLTG